MKNSILRGCLIRGKSAQRRSLQVSRRAATPLSWPLRITSLACGLLLLTMLLTARSLEPSPRGLGTHQQLGLPPCTSVVLFQAPCPVCGMTTAWAWFARGRLLEACQANLGGALLAIIALAYLPTSCYFFFRGVRSRNEWFSLSLAVALLSALAAAVLQWYWR